MKINVFDIEFKTNLNQPHAMTKEPIVLDVPDGVDINSYISAWFDKTYSTIPTFDWELLDDDAHDNCNSSNRELAKNIRNLLKRYFECNDNGDPNPEHDPYYTAQDFADDVHDLIGDI